MNQITTVEQLVNIPVNTLISLYAKGDKVWTIQILTPIVNAGNKTEISNRDWAVPDDMNVDLYSSSVKLMFMNEEDAKLCKYPVGTVTNWLFCLGWDHIIYVIEE